MKEIKLIRTADLRHYTKRTLADGRHRSGSSICKGTPLHEPYLGAGNVQKHADIDGSGSYDFHKALRCDCGADRTEHLAQCYRCGDTKPPELR